MAQSHTVSFASALQEASQLSLAVVNASQKIRRNNALFHRLANDTSGFVDDMIDFYKIMEGYFTLGIPEELAVVFQRTVNSLKTLRNFTLDVASRNVFMAFLFSRSDVREMKAYDETLAMNKDSFKVVSNTYLKSLAMELSPETLEALKQRFEAATGVEIK